MRRSGLLFAVLVLTRVPLHGQITTFPFLETFDTAIPPALPDGWSSSQNRAPAVHDFTTTTGSPMSAPNAVLSTNATIGQWLASPTFSFGALLPDSLVFYTRRSSTHLAAVVVEASLDGGTTFPLTIGDTLRFQVSSAYIRSAFRLPDTLASAPAVAFRWRIIPAASGTTGTFRMDDVRVTARGPDDMAIAALYAVPPSPIASDTLVVTALILNAGERASGDCSISLYHDMNADSSAQSAELLGTSALVTPLYPGESSAAHFTAGPFDAGVLHLIGIISCEPDLNHSNDTAWLALSVRLAPGTVVINEIMYAPEGEEPEWIELANGSAGDVDLSSWQMSDANTGSRFDLTSGRFILPPSGLVVITEDSAAVRALHPVVPSPMLQVQALPAFNNSGDAVVLFDETGETFDSLTYDPSWGGADGHSLERRDVMASSIDPANWSNSTDTSGSTPGAINSIGRRDRDLAVRSIDISPLYPSPGSMIEVSVTIVNEGRLDAPSFHLALFGNILRDSLLHSEELLGEQDGALLVPGDSGKALFVFMLQTSLPQLLLAHLTAPGDQDTSDNLLLEPLLSVQPPGSVLINEIMYEPLTNEAEYVELYNNGPPTDLAGWTVADRPGSDGGRNTFQVPLSSVITPSGAYAVITADSSLLHDFAYLSDGQTLVIIAGSSLTLNNDGDAIALHDATGSLVDSLDYLSDWHHPDVVDETGRSLEKISPVLPSADARNWSTCVLPAGGTPGRPNSILVSQPAVSAALAASPNPFSPDGDGRDDFTVLHFRIPHTLGSVSLAVYDVRGRLIRRLAVREPVSSEGRLVWDGRTEDNAKAVMGMYIAYLEAFSIEGNIIGTAKSVVVLAGRL
jgi:hypothetical protein